MITLIVITIVISLYWLYWTMKSQRMDHMTSSLPGLPALPLLGNGMLFIGDSQKILRNLEEIAGLALKNKGSSKVWLGPKLYVAIGDPEDAQVVLENCLDKDVVYRFLRPWLGHGLFVAPVGLWKSHRKVLLPVFNNKIVEQYLGVIADQADVLLERLSEQENKGKFDVLRYVTACTLDIVFETAMGERMDVQHSPDTPYLRARHTVMTILNMRLFKVWLQPDCLFNLTSYAKQQKDNIDLTHKFTDEVVKKRRLEYERRTFGIKQNLPQSEGKLKAVLDLLFGREIEFTDEQLREHIDSITIAGNDTTALVIAYTLVLLGIHQKAQERTFEEQKDIFGDSKRGANKEDLLKMHYLERVIKESMRLYTVVPIIARNIERDTYLRIKYRLMKNEVCYKFVPSFIQNTEKPGNIDSQTAHCGVTLPAGCGAVVGAFALHRSESAWGPDAHVFDPDRFLPERSADRHPAAFLPFSYGSRNCIGRNFGMLIMKSILSSVVRSYKIDADDIGPLKIEMLLFPINGHQIKIMKRL